MSLQRFLNISAEASYIGLMPFAKAPYIKNVFYAPDNSSAVPDYEKMRQDLRTSVSKRLDNNIYLHTIFECYSFLSNIKYLFHCYICYTFLLCALIELISSTLVKIQFCNQFFSNDVQKFRNMCRFVQLEVS